MSEVCVLRFVLTQVYYASQNGSYSIGGYTEEIV